MRDKLVQFLKALEAAIPPPKGTHHAITFAGYGREDETDSDELTLHVNVAGNFIRLFLEEKDFEKAPCVLANEVAYLIAQQLPKTLKRS